MPLISAHRDHSIHVQDSRTSPHNPHLHLSLGSPPSQLVYSTGVPSTHTKPTPIKVKNRPLDSREVSLHVFNDMYMWKVCVAVFEFLGC